MTRFIASVSGYMYGQTAEAVFVNLFGTSTAKLDLAEVKQDTNYPWDGRVKITVNPQPPAKFTMNVRIPGWARNEAVPGDLYRFSDRFDEAPSISVNGQPMPINLVNGYAQISREWKSGDTIELNLPMPVRRIVANEHVKADQQRVALQRGPLVYCLEWPDNRDFRVRSVVLPESTKLTTTVLRKVLGGVTGVTGDALAIGRDDRGNVTRTKVTMTAIPYYGWANRGRGEMVVWIPTDEAIALQKAPTIASTSLIRTSGGNNPDSLNDQEEPISSADESIGVFHWWPAKGTTEWVEYTFVKPTSVGATEVYWYDDTGRGECRVPQSWRLLYKDGSDWKPVVTSDSYGMARDTFNRVSFKPVRTGSMRLEVTLQPNFSAGIHEWRLNP
jgi:hypothetical protein